MRRLHHIVLSPYARKVRLALAEKRVEVELIEETPWTRELPFLRLNPAATVPVFVDDPGHGGAVVADSAAICEYLEETRPEPPLLAAGIRGRRRCRQHRHSSRHKGRTGASTCGTNSPHR